jgi:hypothetical protein
MHIRLNAITQPNIYDEQASLHYPQPEHGH